MFVCTKHWVEFQFYVYFSYNWRLLAPPCASVSSWMLCGQIKWKWRSFYLLGFKNISRLVRGFDHTCSLISLAIFLSLCWAHGSVTVNWTAVKLELVTRISVALSARPLIMCWKRRLIGLGLYKVEIFSVRVRNRNLSYDYGYLHSEPIPRACGRPFIFRTLNLNVLFHLYFPFLRCKWFL